MSGRDCACLRISACVCGYLSILHLMHKYFLLFADVCVVAVSVRIRIRHPLVVDAILFSLPDRPPSIRFKCTGEGGPLRFLSLTSLFLSTFSALSSGLHRFPSQTILLLSTSSSLGNAAFSVFPLLKASLLLFTCSALGGRRLSHFLSRETFFSYPPRAHWRRWMFLFSLLYQSAPNHLQRTGERGHLLFS